MRRFTLIELLVVVGIIAILASILLPVLSRAKYYARLTSCMSMQRQAAMAALMYADSNDGYWPLRTGMATGQGHPFCLRSSICNFDDRPHLKDYFSDEYTCPFTAPLPLFSETPAQRVCSSYSFYFGYQLSPTAKPMRKVGDAHKQGSSEFDIIAADKDLLYRDSLSESAHPDSKGLTRLVSTNDSFISHWKMGPDVTHQRGNVDLNYTRSDGSVFRVNSVAPEDDRLKKVNYKYSNDSYPLWQRWSQLPVR